MKRRLQRLEALQQMLEAEEVDALVVSSPANIRYLSGFTGEGYLVVGKGELLVATDGRYKVEAEDTVPGCQACCHVGGHLAGVIEFLGQLGAEAVGFESCHLTYSAYEKLAAGVPNVALGPVQGWVERLRLVKDAEEIAAMREAARRVDDALAEFTADLKVGESERRLAWAFDTALVDRDSAPSFSTIMASGPSAASPHAVPGLRRLAKGDMLKIDTGGIVDGYCSDITRTYFVGEPDARFHEVYNIVRQAQAAAVAAVRPGVTGKQLDTIARDIIAEGGYADAFTHSLGHGVGLEIHEGPHVSSNCEDPLQPGMVITIEPGIYLEGWGGVRIEDMVVVTETGCDVLTLAPKPEY